VRKTYGDIAAHTGIPVPVARIAIEERIMEMLGRESFAGFKVPRVLGKGVRHLDLEFIDGLPAIETLSFQSTLDGRSRWQQLGVGLAQVERSLQARSSELFSGLFSVQSQCARIINGIKCGFELVPRRGESRWGSLGDVGLRNILVAQHATYLLDFEFAHFSRRSRDVGQLVSQLNSFERNDLALAVEGGYLSVVPEASMDLSFWKAAFFQYYEKKKWKKLGSFGRDTQEVGLI